MAHHEISLLARLRYPHIVSLLGHVLDGHMYHILLELVAGPSIAELTHSFGAIQHKIIVNCTRQLLDVLQHLHLQPQTCAHRNLTSANVRVTTAGCIKLTSFGRAEMEDVTQEKNEPKRAGAHSYATLYAAPETLNAKMDDAKVDIWVRMEGQQDQKGPSRSQGEEDRKGISRIQHIGMEEDSQDSKMQIR